MLLTAAIVMSDTEKRTVAEELQGFHLLRV